MKGENVPRSGWDDAYSVGSELLDSQHRQLLNLCGTLAELSGSSSRQADIDFHDALNEMSRYADDHFTMEETILESVGYPRLVDQRTEHELYREELVEYLSAATFGLLLKKNLATFLQNWWKRHILEQDMRFKPYLETKSL